jgi:ABC-type glycerol-3-phosphate transport system substrate-binding protein
MAVGAAPVLAQKPKLIYWAYQFLRASDESRVNFAKEWAEKNNVDMQITLVPWKEFMTKVSAAIQAKATPDIVESGGVELRALDQLLEVTDVYQQIEQEYGGWLGAAPLYMKESDGKVHHILYGMAGAVVVARDDLLQKAGVEMPAKTWQDLLSAAEKAQSIPRVYGIGQPLSNQTDSNVWEQIMRSYGARLADDQGKKVVLGDYKTDVWAFLDYFQSVWDAGVLPPGVTTWDNTMNNSTTRPGRRSLR